MCLCRQSLWSAVITDHNAQVASDHRRDWQKEGVAERQYWGVKAGKGAKGVAVVLSYGG